MRELPTPTLPFASLPLDTSRRHLPRAAETVTSEYRLRAAWARTEDELREAQRLRYSVFAEEMGAQVSAPPVSTSIRSMRTATTCWFAISTR